MKDNDEYVPYKGGFILKSDLMRPQWGNIIGACILILVFLLIAILA